MILERIELYQTAVTESESAGEGSKMRRYKRALDSMQTMAKKAKSGVCVCVCVRLCGVCVCVGVWVFVCGCVGVRVFVCGWVWVCTVDPHLSRLHLSEAQII